MPLRWAMPCADVRLSALYTRTRNKPDEGESFLQDWTQTTKTGERSTHFHNSNADPESLTEASDGQTVCASAATEASPLEALA